MVAVNRSKFLLAVVLWLALPVIGHANSYGSETYNGEESYAQAVSDNEQAALIGAAGSLAFNAYCGAMTHGQWFKNPYESIAFSLLVGAGCGAIESILIRSAKDYTYSEAARDDVFSGLAGGAAGILTEYSWHFSACGGSAHAGGPLTPIADLTAKQKMDLVEHVEIIDEGLKP